MLIKKLNAAFEAARNTWAVWLFRPAAESDKGLEMRSNNISTVVCLYRVSQLATVKAIAPAEILCETRLTNYNY